MTTTYSPPPLYPNQSQEPINLTSDSTVQDTTAQNRMSDSDLFMSSVMNRKDTDIRNSLADSLKKVKVYPIFGDKEIAQISINYFLYLEFFHVAIRMFSEVFVTSVVTFAIYWLLYAMCEKEFVADLKLFFNLSNGVLAVFLLKRARGKEETRILNEPLIYNLQWSEDLFSVLVKGLPRDVTEDEVRAYFKTIVSDKACRIIDVMFIHDYHQYVAKKNELVATRKKQQEFEASGKGTEKEMIDLNTLTILLERQIATIDREIGQNRHFRGKAIVIFDKIQNQTEIVRFFTYGWIQSHLILIFRCFFTKYYIRGHRIEAKEIVEPRDLIFENLHRSPFEKGIRLATANSLSFIIVLLGIAVVFKGDELKREAVQVMLDQKILSYVFAFAIMLLAIILEKVYLKTQTMLIHNSAIEAKKGLMDYSLYVSFTIYVWTQVNFALTVDIDFAVKQILRTAMFFGLKTCLTKLVEIYSATKAVEHISQHTSSSFLSSIAKKAQEAYEEFNFVKGITLAYPPLLIGTAFFCADPLLLLPPLILILYGYAILDKFRIIKGSKLYVSKSAAFMLRPFSIYRWIPLYSFVFNLILVSYANSKELKESNEWLFNWFAAIGGFGLLTSMCCPRPLHERVKQKFNEINDYVTYESVCDEFTSIYRKEDPYHRNHFITKSQKI